MLARTSLAQVVVLEDLESKEEHIIQKVVLIAGAKGAGKKETGDELGNVGKGKTKALVKHVSKVELYTKS